MCGPEKFFRSPPNILPIRRNRFSCTSLLFAPSLGIPEYEHCFSVGFLFQNGVPFTVLKEGVK